MDALSVLLDKRSSRSRMSEEVVVSVMLLTVIKVSHLPHHRDEKKLHRQLTTPITRLRSKSILIDVGLRTTFSHMSYNGLHCRSISDLRNQREAVSHDTRSDRTGTFELR